MHEYDVTLKLLLQTSADAILQQVIGGIHVTRWLNAEMQQVQTRRADLLGLATDDRLIHIELQSSKDGNMALRMLNTRLRRRRGACGRQGRRQGRSPTSAV